MPPPEGGKSCGRFVRSRRYNTGARRTDRRTYGQIYEYSIALCMHSMLTRDDEIDASD